MPPSFEWRFDDDPRLRRQPSAGEPARDRRRRWLRRGLILLLGLAVLGLPARALQVALQRANAAEAARLRGLVELELRTIAQGDVELFRSRQDPADPVWQERQVARYLPPVGVSPTGLVPAPGLVPADRPPEITDIHLSGKTARVELLHWYQPTNQSTNLTNLPISSSLPFHLTWFYRQLEQGDWYHVAPLEDDWREPYFKSAGVRTAGERQDGSVVIGYTLAGGAGARRAPGLADDAYLVAGARAAVGSTLSVRATQAEADLLDPIVAELGSLIARGCEWLDCPPQAHFTLNFRDLSGPRVRGDEWGLPTLYLAGRPANDEARIAWEHALKLWLVEMLARSRLDDADVRAQAGDLRQHLEGLSGVGRVGVAGVFDVTPRVVYRQWLARLQAQLGLIELSAPDVDLLARAVAQGKQHLLETLWEGTTEQADPDQARLLESETVVLFDLLERRLGASRLFELLPAFLVRVRPADAALFARYDELDRETFTQDWYALLSRLTGEGIVRFSTFPIVPPAARPLTPPPALALAPDAPGDQIALVCGGRLWVSDADGGRLVLITPPDQRFSRPTWSRDGHWLLTRWQHGQAQAHNALYVVAADGSRGRLLTDDPLAQIQDLRLGPDGRHAFYQARGENRAVDVTSGETRRLPGRPIWSPDGGRLIYAAASPSRPWLADADWGNPRQLADREGLWWERALWSPDGRHLAVIVHHRHPVENTVAIYDLATERISSVITIADLLAAVAAAEGDFVTHGAPPLGADDISQVLVWPLAWSPDGSRLLTWGQWSTGALGSFHLTLLAALAVDGSGSRVVAYGQDASLGEVSWSPTDPERLIFEWRTREPQAEARQVFLFDLNAGPLYASADVARGAWSADGTWVAFVGADAVTIVDREGREHFRLDPPGPCTDVAWNPAADLRRLDDVAGPDF